MKITSKTTLKEALEIKGAEKVLAKYNVPCLGCPFAKMEQDKLFLGDIARMYSLNLKGLVLDLNKIDKK